MRCAACHAPLRCTPLCAASLFATSSSGGWHARRVLLAVRRPDRPTRLAATHPRSARPYTCAFRARAPRRRGLQLWLAPQARFAARRRAAARRAAAMGGCVSVEEKPCPPGTFTSSALLELNLLRAAAMGDVPAAKTALAAGATTAAKTAVRAAAPRARRAQAACCGVRYAPELAAIGSTTRRHMQRGFAARAAAAVALPRRGLPLRRQITALRA